MVLTTGIQKLDIDLPSLPPIPLIKSIDPKWLNDLKTVSKVKASPF
jgi:hypothetical protein